MKIILRFIIYFFIIYYKKMSRVISLRESMIFKDYFQKRKQERAVRRVWFFIGMIFMARFLYLVKTRQINIFHYLPHILNHPYGKLFIQQFYNH